MSITAHFAGTGLLQFSYGQTQGNNTSNLEEIILHMHLTLCWWQKPDNLLFLLKNTSFLMQGLCWYKMPIQDPLSPGVYPAENLVPIYKVWRAKGHWRSQKPRIGAVFHWVNAYNRQSAQKLKVLFTLLRIHSSSVVLTFLPWQIQTKPAPNHAAPAVWAEDPTADQPSQPVPNIHSTSWFPACLGPGFLLNLHLPGQVPWSLIRLAHQP